MGVSGDVIIGFNGLEGFLKDSSYVNALIGRVGNRIGKARFTLEGKTYQLAANNGENHLHGGIFGFDKVLWAAEPFESASEAGVILSYFSPDMEEGYPGNLQVKVIISITNRDEIRLDYTATTDAITHVNLTHHGYFNLNGGKSDIRDHRLKINAARYTELDPFQIPTGRILQVEGTTFDFTTGRRIGERIDQTGGYDLNFVIDKKPGELALAAKASDEESGRVMEVYTTEPGVQLYTSNHFDGSVTGKNGSRHIKYYAFCLETQHFPDTPNQPYFPSTLLRPGETYRQTTLYRFLTR
jgi:aldose 1-epimerase